MQLKISRLINRDNDKDGCRVVVKAEKANIELDFNKDTIKWNAEEIGVEDWEKEFSGVRVFIATHDYFLCKYLEVVRNDDNIIYHSLYKDNGIVKCESAEKITLLEHNSIMKTFVNLYRDEVEASLR